MGEIEYVDAPLDFEIKRETVIVKWSGGLRQAFPIDVFRENYRRAGEALAKYDHGSVVRFPRKPSRRRPG